MVFLFIFLVIILLFIFSKIRIEIENFRFISKAKRHINKDYKLIIKLCILGNIPISKVNITKTKLEKMELKEKIKQMDIKLIKNNNKFDKKVAETIKKLKINIVDADLKVEIGTENAALTALIIPFISTIFSVIFSKSIKKSNNQKYNVKPIYTNENLINILISGIFEIKMIHIINIIYILIKKEGEDKNERTSNRRPYDYSYE